MVERRSEEESKPPRRRRRRWLGIIPVTLFIVGLLFVGVFPTRLYLDQRQEIQDKQANLSELDREVAALESEREQLNDPRALEREARREQLLVPKGAELFVIQEPAPAQVEFPEEWPWAGFEYLVNGS
ncbi:MAG: septum formation initiator family protein [Acidimicrobiales bacterium]